jgi:hypothetical protein
MLTNNCSSFGCKEAVIFEVISLEGQIIGGLCEQHGTEEQAKGPTTFSIIRANWEQEQEQPALPAPKSLMAPPDAVFDEDVEMIEDIREEDHPMPEDVAVHTTTPQNNQPEKQVDKQIPPSAEEASTNFFWRIGKEQVFDMQTTVRGVPTEWGMREHLRAVVGTIRAVVSVGGVSKNTVAFAAPAPVTVATPEALTTATPTPAATPSPAAPSPTGPVPVGAGSGGPIPVGGKPLQVFGASHMEILPQTDGKVQLAFYGPGDKYARLFHKRTPDELMQFLAQTDGWTPDHFKAPGKYEVRYNVTWQESDKMNNKGNPYKNVISVARA